MNSRKRWPKGTWMRLTSATTLKALLDQRGMSLGRLARYSGCDKSFISHLTAGRRRSCTPALAERIAEALEVPLSLLFMPVMPDVEIRNAQRMQTVAS
jgi:transcriptional regulator with XRE-family HTH domain